jgi:NOL1/NOP2/fmu family ribosome biogenesis protein
MMGNLRFLKSKEIKQLRELLEEQWEYKEKPEYDFLMDEEGDVFLINKDIEAIEFEKLRVNSTGLYFAEYRNDEIRLSIEGSQIIGPKAGKSVLDISDEQLSRYLKGEDVETESDTKGFAILKNGGDFFGCSRIKNGKLLNFYPKSRRISTS